MNKFALMVKEVASPDLGRMGMELLSFTIKDVRFVKTKHFFCTHSTIHPTSRNRIVGLVFRTSGARRVRFCKTKISALSALILSLNTPIIQFLESQIWLHTHTLGGFSNLWSLSRKIAIMFSESRSVCQSEHFKREFQEKMFWKTCYAGARLSGLPWVPRKNTNSRCPHVRWLSHNELPQKRAKILIFSKT